MSQFKRDYLLMQLSPLKTHSLTTFEQSVSLLGFAILAQSIGAHLPFYPPTHLPSLPIRSAQTSEVP